MHTHIARLSAQFKSYLLLLSLGSGLICASSAFSEPQPSLISSSSSSSSSTTSSSSSTSSSGSQWASSSSTSSGSSGSLRFAATISSSSGGLYSCINKGEPLKLAATGQSIVQGVTPSNTCVNYQFVLPANSFITIEDEINPAITVELLDESGLHLLAGRGGITTGAAPKALSLLLGRFSGGNKAYRLVINASAIPELPKNQEPINAGGCPRVTNFEAYGRKSANLTALGCRSTILGAEHYANFYALPLQANSKFTIYFNNWPDVNLMALLRDSTGRVMPTNGNDGYRPPNGNNSQWEFSVDKADQYTLEIAAVEANTPGEYEFSTGTSAYSYSNYAANLPICNVPYISTPEKATSFCRAI